MSRVTIKELYWDLNHEELCESDKLWNGAKDIEIVPRKIVEMIIEKCEIKMNEVLEKQDKHPDYIEYYQGEYNALYDMKKYAESLLKQFE